MKKTSQLIKDVVIVGGGAAGWWTAGFLSCKNPELNITLVDSDKVHPIGVGESMLPLIKEFFNKMDLNESVWMKETKSIYKIGNRFLDWYNKGDDRFLSFWWNFDDRLIRSSLYNRPGPEIFWGQKKEARFTDYWLHLYFNKEKTKEDFFYDIQDAAGLLENNCSPVDLNGNSYLSNWAGYAYHIDAIGSIKIIQNNVALPNGVKHINGMVTDVIIKDDNINYIKLADESVIKGDLFIDCSGFARILMNKFDTSLKLYHTTFNDSVCVSPIKYNNYNKEVVPYTVSAAKENGWQFIIPLTSRIGSGYIYSSKYMSDNEAKEAFVSSWPNNKMLLDEPRIIKWIPSRLKKSWQGNVCAIGMSCGLIEPLEANSLYISQYAIETLSNLLIKKNYMLDQNIQSIFCKFTDVIYDQTAEYLSAWFLSTNRTDTEYWRDYKKLGEKEKIKELIESHYASKYDPSRHGLNADSTWTPLGLFTNSFSKKSITKVNPNLIENAKAMFEYNKKITTNNGKILPKIWEVCPYDP